MKQPNKLATTTMKKHVLLALVVLVIGVPINYQIFSHWKKAEFGLHISDQKQETQSIPTIVTVSPEVSQIQDLPLPRSQIQKRNSRLVSLRKTHDRSVVQLTQSVINSLGVRTKKVKRSTIYRQIDSIGQISVDENNIRDVSLRTEGWVEELLIKSVGDRVSKGDLLLKIYSPKLINAQEDFIRALDIDQTDGGFVAASKLKLIALGVSEVQIEVIHSNRIVQPLVNVYAPQDGFVFELSVREGGFVSPSKSVVRLVDLSSVWLLANVFENKINWLKKGQNVEATLPFMPGKKWHGTVDFVYPSLDPVTRSVKARLKFENPDEQMKPNMFANVSIFTSPKLSVLTVPREAVIKTGNQSRVIVAMANGKFKPVIVQTGIETNAVVEIVSGLKNGEKVVVSSQFLIDSESSMQAAMTRLAGNL